MPKRVYIALAVLLVILAGVIAWQGLRLREREPEYQGRGLRTWLREARGQSNRQARGRAEAAIRQIGTNAIPTLLEMLRQKDSPLTSKLIPWWGRHIAERRHLPSLIRLPPWYRNQAQILNSEAERGFEILGTNAQQTVTALMEVCEQNISPSSRMYAAGALSGIAVAAPSTVPSFLRWAASTNQSVRLLAVSALSRGRLEPSLVVASTNKYVRLRAVGVLSQGRFEPSLVVPALSKWLSDADNDVRLFAAQGLGWYGAEARQAVPALVPLLSDPNGDVRTIAAIALKKIDPEAAAKAGVK